MANPSDRAQALRVLAQEIRAEVTKIEETAAECAAALRRLGHKEPDRLELMGVGGLLQSFYNGVERALQRIAPELNGGIPAGEHWHRRLLDQLTLEVPDVRPAVLGDRAASSLREYLMFRHRFRNMYAFDLRWPRCRELLAGVAGAWSAVRADLEEFARFVDRLAASTAAPPG
jgi:ribonuclease HepT-like protein